MNKLLLTALAALSAASAWAGSLTPSLRPDNSGRFETIAMEVGPGTRFNAPASRAENSLPFTLAGDPYGAARYSTAPNNAYKHCGFEFNAENATRFAGNKITSVSICTGTNKMTNRNAVTSAIVYLTYDIQDEPFYSQDVTLGTSAFTFYDCPLDQPYTIEAGKAVYIMYKFTNKSSMDYYLVYDGVYHDNDEGGWFGYDTSNGILWDNVTDYYGYIPMKATITGDNIPTDGATIWGAAAPSYVVPGETFSAQVGVTCAAAGSVNSVEVTTTVGDTSFTQSFNISGGLTYGQRTVLTISDLKTSLQGFDVPVKMEITKVNGKENTTPSSYTTTFMCFDKANGYPRNVLVEEATGTWCGWCPRGIVLLEALREKYTDGSVALVAVHNDDEMAVNECQAFIQAYVSGFPYCVANRSEELDFTMSNFEEVYNYFRNNPAAVTISANASVADDDATVTVTGSTRFALGTESRPDRFLLSFYLTEDGMGPYTQANYYSGGSNGALDPFDNLPSKTPVTFNDVARTIKDFPGIKGSVPATIKADEDNAYSYQISLANVTSQKFNVVAMVVDGVSGEVLNCCVIPASKHSGVSSAVADNGSATVTAANGIITVTGATAPVAVYTIDGRCVATAAGDTSVALASGLYIVHTGDTTVKVRL